MFKPTALWLALSVSVIFTTACDNSIDSTAPPGAPVDSVTDTQNPNEKDQFPIDAESNLPPNPIDIAPPLPVKITDSILNSVEFLYSGDNPIQTGVVTDAIDSEQVAVIRGRVLDETGADLPSVKISIQGYPSLGQTLSRTNGQFDLAVNGGKRLVVDFSKKGYLPAQRTLNISSQDFTVADDVILVSLDTVATSVNINHNELQIAKGSQTIDQDGQRQATVLFPPGTTATMTLGNSLVVPLDTLTVRATEYTVGSDGPNRMPGTLPLRSGYTYAVELSIDEAIAAGAKEVSFNHPLPVYVDNFLDFPTGETVPSGWYDRERAKWVPSADGRIIEVMAISENALADLDIDGSATIATESALADLGITTEERAYLAKTYSLGKTLWRIPVTHFTPWDFNWPYGPPADAIAPPTSNNPSDADNDQDLKVTGNDTDSCVGCQITPQGQILGEQIPIAGTPFSLHYTSNRVPGYKASSIARIPLSGAIVPASLVSTKVTISIAGKKFSQTFDSLMPNQQMSFEWDGFDAYGRQIFNATAKATVTYLYPAHYFSAYEEWESSFNEMGDTSKVIGIREDNALIEISTQTEYPLSVPNKNDSVLGLWNINVQHTIDNDKNLHAGYGAKFPMAKHRGWSSEIVTGNQSYTHCISECSPEDGKLAINIAMEDRNFNPFTVGSDGTQYFFTKETSQGGFLLRSISPEGVLGTVAGNGTRLCLKDSYPEENVLATNTSLCWIYDIALDNENNIYILDGKFVRKITNDGLIHTIAGHPQANLACVYNYDSSETRQKITNLGDALEQDLCATSIVTSPDGELYIADRNARGILKVTQDGRINVVIAEPDRVQGPLPTVQQRVFVSSMAFSPDGTLYFLDTQDSRYKGKEFYSLSPMGQFTLELDFSPYLWETWSETSQIAIDSQGRFYFVADLYVNDDFITAIVEWSPGEDFDVSRIIAGSANRTDQQYDLKLPATKRWLDSSLSYTDLDAGPEGELFFSNINMVTKLFPDDPNQLINNEYFVPDPNNQTVHVFNESGQHIRTVDAASGIAQYIFEYNESGHLVRIADGNNESTNISRFSDGTPIGITGPNGQFTAINTDASGYIASVTSPENQGWFISYEPNGLLTSFTDRNGNETRFEYDDTGRLIKDTDPLGGGWTLSRAGSTTTMTSAEGRQYGFTVQSSAKYSLVKTNTLPDGSQLVVNIGANDSKSVTLPNGSIITSQTATDPRFGSFSPYQETIQVKTPSGLTKTLVTGKSVIDQQYDNFFGFSQIRSYSNINQSEPTEDGSYLDVFDLSSRTRTFTTPEGYRHQVVLNEKNKPETKQITGLARINFQYDQRGRLTSIGLGEDNQRSTVFEYGTSGYLNRVTNALNQTTSMTHDANGRILSRTFADNGRVEYAYDANHNLVEVRLANGELHQFTYTEQNKTASHRPPDDEPTSTDEPTTINAPTTFFHYNLDRQLTDITRPDGRQIKYSYGTANGKLTGITTPSGQTNYSYFGDESNELKSGQLKSIATSEGIGQEYQYDGHLITEVKQNGSISGTLKYSYYNNFLPSNIQVNGENLYFEYNQDSQLTTIGDMTLGYQSSNGLLAETSLINSLTQYEYNTFGEIGNASTTINGDAHYEYSLVRDANGLVVGKTETVLGEQTIFSYAYDSRQRLTAVVENNIEVEKYEYDANGNRLSDIYVNKATYDAQDRLLSYGDITYRYNAAGDLTSITNAADITEYQYDVFSNLRSATLPDGTEVEYLIDGHNRRIGKKVNGTLKQGFLYQGQLKPVAELDGDSNVISRFVYAESDYVPSFVIKGGERYRVLTDHIGSVRLVTNASTGVIAQKIDYDAFGKVINDSNPGFQPFGFAGGLYDLDTKLTRFGTRDYDAETGRWTTKDPIGLNGGLNLYVYVGNNPVNFIDPSGHILNFGTAVIGAAVGGVFGGIDAYLSGENVLAGVGIGVGTGAMAGLSFGTSLLAEAGVFALGVGVDMAVETGTQLSKNGGNFKCLNGGDILSAGFTSAIFGGLGSAWGKVGSAGYGGNEQAEALIGEITSSSAELTYNALTEEYY